MENFIKCYEVTDPKIYGFNVMPINWKNEDVHLTDDTLTIGGIEVVTYKEDISSYKEMTGRVPKLYCIRRWSASNQYLRFVCGFDLLEDGRCWWGGTLGYRETKNGKDYKSCHFNSIKEGIEFISSVLIEGWVITLEEPM